MNERLKHDWKPTEVPRKSICNECGMLRWRLRDGFTRFIRANGATHDTHTVDESDCVPDARWREKAGL